MKVNLVRAAALALGLSLTQISYAEFGQNDAGQYVPPSKWNRFNAIPTAPLVTQQAVSTDDASEDPSEPILVPTKPLAPRANYSVATQAGVTPLIKPPRTIRPVGGSVNGTQEQTTEVDGSQYPSTLNVPNEMSVDPNCTVDGYSPAMTDTGEAHVSPYAEAMNAPWSDCEDTGPCTSGYTNAPARRPLSPWFASSEILFWNMANPSYRRFIIQDGAPANTHLSSNHVAPDNTTGYNVSAGRYFDCGRYGVAFSYFNFDPDSEQAIARTPVAGDYYSAMPHWNQVSIDRDGAGPGAPDTVYNIYDNAAAFRATRDVDIQGLELNLFCFGIGGARRITPACGSGLGCGPLGRLRNALCLNSCNGYTTSPGSLERPCDGCLQIVNSHGFRWFQFKDQLELASTDAYDGYVGPTDMFYCSQATNNLYGYQFGSRLLYCLGPRLSGIAGGKAGLYGNDVSVEQKLGTMSTDAYVTTDNTQRINTHDRDVVLAGLGEVELGLGYRINNAWTFSGGYRMLYATGVATSIGSIANEYYSLGSSSRAYADEYVLLHGAYFGTAFNW